MRTRLFIISFFIFCAGAVQSQEISISAAFDSTRILIGDQIYFTISVEQPENLGLKLPTFSDTIIKNIEIINGPETDTSISGNGRLRITEKYLVTSFDSGFYQVDPLYVEVKDSGEIKRYFSDYTRLEVMKYRVAPADTAATIYDIIEPYRMPMTLREILPWALAAIAAGVLIWAVVSFVRKRRKAKLQVEETVIIEPAHVIAFRELEKLKAEALWQNGHFKLYYTRLTEILRQYLEKRYGVLSLELTTSETLAELLRTGFRKGPEYEQLRTVLTAADLVKFAKYVPVAEENESHFVTSWDFVEATKEIPVTVTPLPENSNEQEGKS